MIPIPGEKFAAPYVPGRRQLTIIVEGRVPVNCKRIDLIRDPIPGLLLFRLLGDFGGEAPSRITRPYFFRKSFYVTVRPGQVVIIITENYPNGKIVPVTWLSLGAKPSETISDPVPEVASSTALVPTLPDIIIDPQPILKDVSVGATFNVDASVPPTPGSLTNVFDNYGFAIESANIEMGSLVWTMKALVAGTFIITLRSWLPGTAEPDVYSIREKVYIIDVHDVYEPQEAASDVAETFSEDLGVVDSLAPLQTWLDILKKAHEIVKIKVDKKAKFTRVYADHGRWISPSIGIPPFGIDPLPLDNLQAIFKVEGGYAHIFSVGGGKWKDLYVVAELRIGEATFNLDGVMGIYDAELRLRKKGYWESIITAELYKEPAEIEIPERGPSYYFHLERPRNRKGLVVEVDAKTGRVTPRPDLYPVPRSKTITNGATDKANGKTTDTVTNGTNDEANDEANGEANVTTKTLPPPPVSVAA